ncbi:hypothetical protein TWF718_004132 [Orbilia javanica]|uniref:Ketoreductase (KR) domain-containing protein n=1 Tax=Orbilia javanica TaxID=47235 RepID=A0AAN8RQ33_9PEZI
MSYTEWSKWIASRVSGSWNLHSILPKELDFFVLLSSLDGVIGTQAILGLKLLHTDPQLDVDSSGTNWRRNPMFQEQRRLTEITSASGGSGGQDVTSRFTAAKSNEEATEILIEALTKRLLFDGSRHGSGGYRPK